MRTLAAFVFPGFETLDYFGPIEMLGGMTDHIEVVTVASSLEPVASVHGQHIVPDRALSDGTDYDLLLIPGGDSALLLENDQDLMRWIAETSDRAERVMAVCTGTILLGMSGVLDGKSATTNKLDFTATVPLVPKVNWVKEARWVEDEKFYTSSGVSAGMDMALAVLADLYGMAVAEKMAVSCEYTWHKDKNDDPFAKLAGLV